MAEISLMLKEARRLVKKIKIDGWETNIRIAVLGSTSIQYLVLLLRYLLYQENINADIYEGEYNGITMDVFDQNSALYDFLPEIVIIYTYYLDIKQFPMPLDQFDVVNDLADQTIQYYINIWKAVSQIPGVTILQTNFAYPAEHLFGNLESFLSYSKTNFYRLVNQKINEHAFNNVNIIDMELLAENIGKYNWFDYPSYFLTKTGFKLDYLGDLVKKFVDEIKALRGNTRKCMVLDLDNTLWGGIVGDEGYNGIQIDPNNAVGEAYRYFQGYLLELKQRGIILAVCSKNDLENAKEPFEKNPNMILKLKDIACFVANWEDKATNIRGIARELNIGTDSLVFFDDNPAEREIVKRFLPEVHVVDVPKDPALYVHQLVVEAPFEWLQITKEDLTRNNSYIQNRERQKLKQNFVDYRSYLKALEMKGETFLVSESEAGRFTQLLNKSNQFNLRTQRYAEADIKRMIEGNEKKCIAVRLEDRFSEYGIISCVILEKRAKECFIESWVMSCRVLKRNVEQLAFMRVINEAKRWGCNTIIGEYIPSKKNKMVENFYDEVLGFELETDDVEIKRYRFDVEKEFKPDIFIVHRKEQK